MQCLELILPEEDIGTDDTSPPPKEYNNEDYILIQHILQQDRVNKGEDQSTIKILQYLTSQNQN